MHNFSTAAPKTAALTALRSVALLNVLKSTFAGAWGTRLRVTRLVRPAFSAPRYENLCIIPASSPEFTKMPWRVTSVVVLILMIGVSSVCHAMARPAVVQGPAGKVGRA